MSVAALLVLFLLAASTAVLARRGDPDFVYARSGVPRPASNGPLSLVVVIGAGAALGFAALLAIYGDPLDDALAVAAVVCGGVAAVLGGLPIAVAVLDLADSTTGPADGVKAPQPPPVGPSFDPRRPGPPVPMPTVPPARFVPPGPPVPATPGADPDADPAVDPSAETRPVATAGPVDAGIPPGAVATAAVVPAGPADPRLLGGGIWIGALERGAVVGALLTGYPEGIALLLVVKGFGRYPELHQPAAAERFIIGTLVSILWAAGCAGVTLALIR